MSTMFALLVLLSLATPGASKILTLPLHVSSSLPEDALFSDQSTALSAPVFSGLVRPLAAYVARMGIGSPVMTYSWIIDTGSDLTWLQCKPCDQCFNQYGPIFDPLHSTSYYFLPCGTTCDLFTEKACDDDTCLYRVKYAGGSTTYGDAGSETLTFEDSQNVEDIVIGCSRYTTKMSVSGPTGLIGLGRGPLSLPSQLDATSFSFCLVDRGSINVTTLEFNKPAPTESIKAPMVRNPHFPSFWFIEVEGISVGGQTLSLPPSMFAVDPTTGRGGAVVDSGSATTRLPTRAYNALRNEFLRLASNLERADSFDVWDTCFSSPPDGIFDVPSVAFVFTGNRILNLPREGILYNFGQKACLAFLVSASDTMILGNAQMQTMLVHFGIADSVMSFVPNSC